MRTTRLRVSLREVRPAVVRTVDVPADILLPELHDVFQVAIGWTDSHLHQWVTPDTVWGHGDELLDDQRDEVGVLLRDLPSTFRYDYDFGDGWEHDVEVLGPGGEEPGVVDGEGTCPPEDCGGVGGYAELLDVLADPAHPEHASMKQWCGPLLPFDLERASRDVRATVGAVPPSARRLLDLVGDEGLALTPSGRLPRAVVHAFLDEHPSWSLTGKASLEEHLRPLARLHDLLREAGLLRVAKGRLLRTKASYDELQSVRRIRAALEPGSFSWLLEERVVAVLLAGGAKTGQELAPAVYSLIGPGWSVNGRPLDVEAVRRALWRLDDELEGLDLVVRQGPVWRAGPAAPSVLPGVPLLAGYLERGA